MPKVSPVQTSFNTGEISPLMAGRVDFDKYKSALKTCLNHIPLVQGGVTRRPGTLFAGEVKTSSLATRIVRFEFSTTQAYILEFGNLYVRFYANHGQVQSTHAITGAANNGTGLIRLTMASTTGLYTGNRMTVTAVGGTVEANATWTITVISATQVDLQGSAFVNAYTAGGTSQTPVEVPTLYTTAELWGLSFTQSADVLYIAHAAHPPATLNRLSATNWTYTAITFTDGPYYPQNTDAANFLQVSIAGTGAGTLTATSATFVATDVGRVFRMKCTAQAWAWGTITSFTNTTTVDVTMATASGAAASPTATWRLGAWSVTTGYPGCVTFFQDRLCWAATPAKPQTIYMSVTGNYVNHQPTAYDVSATVIDSHALNITLNSNDVQLTRWMSGDAKGLLVGTVAGEWIVTPSTLGGALTPTNIDAVQMTAYGNAAIQPVRVGYTTLAVQRSLRKVRELTFVYAEDRYHAPDMTVLAQHITYGGVVDMAFQQEPNSMLWFPRTDGTLLCFVYERDQNVVGWSRNTIGGTNAVVESVATIPAPDGTRNELWLVVRRTIGGVTKRYIEYMTKMWERGDSQVLSVYVDCALQYAGVPTSTFSGAVHLAGETVAVLADGAVHPDCVVSGGGTITLNKNASNVSVGYRYNSDGETLRNDAGSADGTAQGKTQRTHFVGFRFHDSLSVDVGPDFTHLSPFIDRNVDGLIGHSVDVYSGDRTAPFEGDYTTENLICWRFSDPLPGTVLAVMPQQHTMDR